jgi:hypothetical protein
MTVIDPNPAEKKTPTTVPNIPVADIDLMDVAKLVSKYWTNVPQITLIWVTQPNFDILVTNYSSTLMLRKTTGSGRSEYTQKLKLLDVKIDNDIENIKRYLVEKYDKKSAPSYYAQFGIVKVNKKYKLPYDRDERKASLALLLTAISVHGFENNIFGLTYWTDTKTQYDSLLSNAEAIDGSVSDKVGAKNLLKKQIKKVLNSLIKVIQGNYPDDYKTVLRTWGFQKEKY